MSSFDEREKGFEKKFVHDEEIQFKISARRNKYIGQWVSKIFGYKKKDFPLAEFQAKHLITLPIHQFLNKNHIDYIFKNIKNFYSNN